MTRKSAGATKRHLVLSERRLTKSHFWRSSGLKIVVIRKLSSIRFEILDGPRRTRAEVVLVLGGVGIIERGGKDPKLAVSIALHRLLKAGRDPFESLISLQIPYGHAAHFSKYGNFDS